MLSDFSVLCRIKSQLKAIEKAFRDHNIPYQRIGNASFFKQEPVETIINLMALSLYPDNGFLKRKVKAKEKLDVFQLPGTYPPAENRSVSSMVTAIIDEYFKHDKSKYASVLNHLICLTDGFGDDPQKFIGYTALCTETDTYKSNTENVSLMTLHAAKGLEFKCVFIIGCEDGLIPYSLFESQKSDLDEERRLLYVGMTRAEEFLFLSYAKRRTVLGKKHSLGRSPFLNSIEKELIELSQSDYKRKEKPEERQLSLF